MSTHILRAALTSKTTCPISFRKESTSRLVAMLSLPAALLLTAVPARSQSVPPVGPASLIVRVTNISINPQAPPVGSNYVVTARVYSRHGRSLLVRATIQVPNGDVVLSSVSQNQVIGSGQYVTYTWTVYCGVDGGTVRVKADPVREL